MFLFFISFQYVSDQDDFDVECTTFTLNWPPRMLLSIGPPQNGWEVSLDMVPVGGAIERQVDLEACVTNPAKPPFKCSFTVLCKEAKKDLNLSIIIQNQFRKPLVQCGIDCQLLGKSSKQII